MQPVDRPWLTQTFGALVDQMKETMDRKSRDYSGANDPFANLTLCERLGIATAEQGILTRLCDKFSRMINLLQPGAVAAVKNEAVEDTILDAATYLLLLHCFLRAKREGSPEWKASSAAGGAKAVSAKPRTSSSKKAVVTATSSSPAVRSATPNTASSVNHKRRKGS